MNLFAFARQLIDIPSVSGDELAVARFLAEYLEAAGFETELQEVEENRANLIAAHATVPPRVVLSTHLDTVPPHVAASEDGEYIYGRGACDAKGIIAAQVAAARQLRAEGIDDVGLLFTVDEEQASLGALAANRHRLARLCQFLINGEPTDNLLATGSKGSLRARVKTAGRAAHSAYPEHGESAIEKLLDVLRDVRDYDWPRDEFFGETTVNVGTVAGGTRSNVVPAEAEAVLHIRLTVPSGVVKEALERIAGARAEVEYLSVSEPVRMLPVESFEQCIVRFTTDVTYLSGWGRPLLIGPGSILDAHTAHERVAKRELEKAVELYVRLVRRLRAGVEE
ncbi:MAG TPA: M20/M25/M40 family metallo-hydrolase [Pyrinomonadaceae bacterium]|jgi:acetylornithine deacetylase